LFNWAVKKNGQYATTSKRPRPPHFCNDDDKDLIPEDAITGLGKKPGAAPVIAQDEARNQHRQLTQTETQASSKAD